MIWLPVVDWEPLSVVHPEYGITTDAASSMMINLRNIMLLVWIYYNLGHLTLPMEGAEHG